MNSDAQKRILNAFYVVLRPIARILLRYGVGFREFSEVAKSAFVEVATTDYGIRGRPTNISRVAVMTGLTRKEVRRIRDQLSSDEQRFSVKSTPLAQIMFKWHSTDEFLGEDGRPLTLPFSGDGITFSELVRRFGGDIPPGAMRTELKRVGAIEEDSDGLITALRRIIHPPLALDNLCMTLLHGAYPLLANIAHNTDPNRDEPGWPQLTAFSGEIAETDVVRLRRICEDKSKSSVQSFDDLLMAFENQKDSANGAAEKPMTPIAIGMFYFEERNLESKSIWND